MRAQAPAQTLLNITVWKCIFKINDVSAAFLHCRAGKNLILEYRICHCLAHSTCIYQKISSHIGAYMVPHAVQKFHYAQNKQNIFLSRRRRFCLVSTCVSPSPPGGGGSPWKVLAVRPYRAFFLALSPYVRPMRSCRTHPRAPEQACGELHPPKTQCVFLVCFL